MKPKRVLKDEELQKQRKDNKKSLKTPKYWIIEYKWLSKHAYDTSPKWFLYKKEYTKEWQKDDFNANFVSAKAALESIKSRGKNNFLKDYSYKAWRTRNIKTQQVINYDSGN